tara:strand:+ start:63 stop:257 length:195 start_codon:yes stop_codon:yes gene_type:complete
MIKKMNKKTSDMERLNKHSKPTLDNMQELLNMATKIAKEVKDIKSGRARLDSKGNIVGYNWEEK